MTMTRVLLLVLAGGAGSRLSPLTDDRAKPAVPFGGSFRLIDFSLSNAQHSHVPDVWVIEQYNPASLADHLSNGRPWDLDRSSGGLLLLHPHRGSGREGWHSGTADALWRQAALVRDFEPDVLMVVSADAVYRVDYREVADQHLRSGAGVTMVTTEVPRQKAARYGVVTTDAAGMVTDYAYKPDEPGSTTVTMEVFAFQPNEVLDLPDRLADEAGDDGLDDLGDHGLPQLVEAGRARSLPMGPTGRTSARWRPTGAPTWNCWRTLRRSHCRSVDGRSTPRAPGAGRRPWDLEPRSPARCWPPGAVSTERSPARCSRRGWSSRKGGGTEQRAAARRRGASGAVVERAVLDQRAVVKTRRTAGTDEVTVVGRDG